MKVLIMVNHLLTRNRRSSFRRAGERGFTLVEMLVVISIIALIMALVAPRVLNFLGESKVKAAKIQIESLESALDLYALDTGHYPSTSEGLDALMHSPGGVMGWSGPYLKGNVVPKDPWGKPYIYRSPGEHGPYDIVSYGPNGRAGGTGASANINSWSR
jgi:general secretion pathway protein G